MSDSKPLVYISIMVCDGLVFYLFLAGKGLSVLLDFLWMVNVILRVCNNFFFGHSSVDFVLFV